MPSINEYLQIKRFWMHEPTHAQILPLEVPFHISRMRERDVSDPCVVCSDSQAVDYCFGEIKYGIPP